MLRWRTRCGRADSDVVVGVVVVAVVQCVDHRHISRFCVVKITAAEGACRRHVEEEQQRAQKLPP